MGDPRRGDWPLMAVLVAIVLGVTVCVATARPRATYSIRVENAVSQFARYRGRRVRVRGAIVPGSVVKRARDCDVKFDLAQTFPAAKTLHVHYEGCDLPQTFCDLSGEAESDLPEVFAEGRLISDNGRIELAAEELSQVWLIGKYELAGPHLFCARYRPGDDCPICESIRSARQNP
jgi:cytochrome c-type biogenesis protein CcmE